MALELMYITNRPDVARLAQESGVDRIWIDMEYIGKEQRQKGLDTVKSYHTIADIKRLRPLITRAALQVRINPIHKNTSDEIENTICAGADYIMLPYFKTSDEVRYFIKEVNGRCKTMLLLETKEAVEHLDKILNLPGIDEVHIGLNDLHLAYGKNFMFELLQTPNYSQWKIKVHFSRHDCCDHVLMVRQYLHFSVFHRKGNALTSSDIKLTVACIDFQSECIMLAHMPTPLLF